MTLRAFSKVELLKVHTLLASCVASMQGRKLEEGDWAGVYCGAKQIPNKGWSNLNIDVCHAGLGIEHKMMCVRKKSSIKEYCGTCLMHPAATRSIRIGSLDRPANDAAKDVLQQYAELINGSFSFQVEDMLPQAVLRHAAAGCSETCCRRLFSSAIL